MNKVALHTLGCKLNFSETSTIGNQFLKHGFDVVDFNSAADIYVINTCTVTENANKECRQIIRRALKKNPEAYIIVTGCYAQLKPEEIAGIGGVDLVLGNQEKFDLFSFVNKFKKEKLACINVSSLKENNDFGFAASSDADSRTRAYLKIQDGCDYKCSFCTIPLARGESRSLEPEKVLKEFNNLLDKGYKEIILTGVNVGDYGKQINSNLLTILEFIDKIPGEFRVRISSIEPNLLSDGIIELAASSKKICNHFHIPLQSGSKKILRLMKRRYTIEDYYKLIFKVKERIPDAGLGVDVIVGFPGETEDDFIETMTFLESIPVSYLHVFTYSERENTVAIGMKNRVEIQERRRRNNILREISINKRNEFLQSLKGKTLSVLFEHNLEDGLLKGYSSNYARVHHKFNPEIINQIKDTIILDIENEYCFGKVLEQKK